MSDGMPYPIFRQHRFRVEPFFRRSSELLLLFERRTLGVVPNRCKGISLTRLCVHRDTAWRILPIRFWIRADRQNMVSGRHPRVVTLIDAEDRNLDAVDNEVNRLVSAKVR